MPDSTIIVNANVGGIPFSSSCLRTDHGQIGQDPPLPAAKAGTLTTRTNATDGILTLGVDHGITTDDYIDIYWTDSAGVKKYRYGADVTAADGTTVTFEGEPAAKEFGGSDLPAQDYAITTQARTEIDVDFDGDLLKVLAVSQSKRGLVRFLNGDTVHLVVDLTSAGEIWYWTNGSPITNPLAGDTITHVFASQSAVEAGQAKIGVLYDSTV